MDPVPQRGDSFDLPDIPIPDDVLERMRLEDEADFREVGHEECVYGVVPKAIELLINKAGEIRKDFNGIETTSDWEERLMRLLINWLDGQATTIREIAKSLLHTTRELEREHEARQYRCYATTKFNLEKYSIVIGHQIDTDDWVKIEQLLSTLPKELIHLKVEFFRWSTPALCMQQIDRDIAWEYVMTQVIGKFNTTPSIEQLLNLKNRFSRLLDSSSAALAEVHFGDYKKYTSLPRVRVADYAELFRDAAIKESQNRVDSYARAIKKGNAPNEASPKEPLLVKGMSDLASNLVIQASKYGLWGYRARKYVIQQVGFDPIDALAADINDEALRCHRTIESITKKLGIPATLVYNRRRRFKYGAKRKYQRNSR